MTSSTAALTDGYVEGLPRRSVFFRRIYHGFQVLGFCFVKYCAAVNNEASIPPEGIDESFNVCLDLLGRAGAEQ